MESVSALGEPTPPWRVSTEGNLLLTRVRTGLPRKDDGSAWAPSRRGAELSKLHPDGWAAVTVLASDWIPGVSTAFGAGMVASTTLLAAGANCLGSAIFVRAGGLRARAVEKVLAAVFRLRDKRGELDHVSRLVTQDDEELLGWLERTLARGKVEWTRDQLREAIRSAWLP